MRFLVSTLILFCMSIAFSYGVQQAFAKQTVSAAADGQCRLYNEKSNNYKYEGSCEIGQKMSSGANEYNIRLGNGDTYHFVQQGSGYKVQTPEGMSDHMAAMTDSGNTATFEWYKWKLTAEVTELADEAPESSTKASASERAGQGQFDATGKIPCAQSKGQPMGQCSYGVARDSGGTASVAITMPDGRKRFIFFENGKPVSADLSQADGNMDFSYIKEADLYMIRAGNERYEIPEAVIYGG